MAFINSYEEQLTGGHPNSLGNTEAVVADVLQDKKRCAALYACYGSNDEVVRLRVSSAFKRIFIEHRPEWFAEYIDRFIDDVAHIPQASANWSFSQIISANWDQMSAAQRAASIDIMVGYLESHDDWIVLNLTMKALAQIAAADPGQLADRIRPLLQQLERDPRKSVSKTAKKSLAILP